MTEEVKKIVKFDAALRREVKTAAKMRILSQFPLCIAAAAIYLLPALLVGMLTAVPITSIAYTLLA
ncbi:MAG: hypothetical protein J6L72_04300, partial [Butyricicoccus sp.]|nr:hypothetical protein [Butyricicoccus sp.]